MIQIRPATAADVPLIRAFIQELADYEREPDAVKITEAELLRDGFSDAGERYFACLIAEQDGEPAGFALYFPIYSTWRGRSLHLEDLFVRPAFRRLGIGRALLQRVAALAVERGCARLQWDVLAWNEPAIAVYRSLNAEMLDEWRRMRVADTSLAALSAAADTEEKTKS
ncbi:GNAT family N-acetyltransferase [Silvibacterium dinghuense]|uniref:GNAT family N-acetyltransferase n=1 Tax=Silvibacterium dinghuense TaxID=1560006 RepID=A0A4V1NVU1_9BACT|nr:GNAT family N-acetyltransferase [Silvibacterium dinghuense]RXS97102.1 GNAT family N-acetyltransferase [Silvibacterium dinghuense]GGG96245.1 GCN5 family N-acetyltransferase [Silvibacterium dinghuense]